jgi:hypothetical protein
MAGATLRLSLWSKKDRRGGWSIMRKLKRILAAILVALVIGIGAFAQRGGDDKRPPKEDNKVKVRDKDKQQNNKGSSGNTNKRRP